MELFGLQKKTIITIGNKVLAILISLIGKPDETARLQVKLADEEDKNLYLEYKLKKHESKKPGVIEFLRLRFLGTDIEKVLAKPVKTADEVTEISKYNQAKINLQKNLLIIWNNRLQEVKDFQKKKAEKEAIQSQYFRDNFYVRTELKKIVYAKEINKKNRKMFAEFWKSIFRLNFMFQKITKSVKLRKMNFVKKKNEMKFILVSLSKIKKLNCVSKNYNNGITESIFYKSVKTSTCLKLEISQKMAKKTVGEFFENIRIRESFCEAFGKYDSSCKIIRLKSGRLCEKIYSPVQVL